MADAAEIERLTRKLWLGDCCGDDWAQAETSTSPTALLLRGEAAFLLACLTGDSATCDAAATRIGIAEQACAAAAASSWANWTASWVGLASGPTAEQELASGQLALSLMLKGVVAGMQQQHLAALLALRRSYATFGRLSSSVPAVQPLRNLGLGCFEILLSFLPSAVGRLVALTAGRGGTFSEAEGNAMLQAAASDPACVPSGVGWMPKVAQLLFLNAKAHLTQAEGSQKAKQDAEVLEALRALEAALPGSLVFDWVGATILRRLGDSPGALERLSRVVARAAAEIESETLLACRLRFNEGQMLFALGKYGAAQQTFEKLLAPPARFTAACMCCTHLAASCAAQGDVAGARAAMARLQERAAASSGRLDAQLAQRVRGWAERNDEVLPLCALELAYMMGYLHQNMLGASIRDGGGGGGGGSGGGGGDGNRNGDDARACAYETAALPTLRRALAAGVPLETRMAARLVLGAMLACKAEHVEARVHFEAVVAACASPAGTDADEFAQLPDQWCLPFALNELAKTLLLPAPGGGPPSAEQIEHAQAALKSASRVPPRCYSFHSWLQSSVRQTRKRCAVARRASGVWEDAAGDGDDEGDEGGDHAELEKLRRQLDEEEEQREHKSKLEAVD